MTKQKIALIEIFTAALLYILAKFLPFDNTLFFIGPREITPLVLLFFAAYLVAGFDTLKEAVYNIFHGQIFDENFLMTVASIGALCLGEYPEAVAVMLFYKIGETFENYAVNKSRNSISALMNIRPEYANLLIPASSATETGSELAAVSASGSSLGETAFDSTSESVVASGSVSVAESSSCEPASGSASGFESVAASKSDLSGSGSNYIEKKVDPYEVKTGDIIIVKPGEKVPLDGIVTEGNSRLDTSALTGESMPRDVATGEEILSGCVNLSGLLKIKVTSEYENSTVAKILDLVENAASKKAPMEKFITRFAKYYTPIVVFAAIALALIPPLLVPGQTFSDWISRSLIFLVISCPCALVISIPLSFFGGIGAASKSGILVKGSSYLEALSKAETVIFDKTGTLTTGTFGIINIVSRKLATTELLKLAAYGENYSNHPISASIKAAYGQKIDTSLIDDVREIPGEGTACSYEGKELLVGNAKLMDSTGISGLEEDDTATMVHVAWGGKYCGYIALADTIKTGIPEAIDAIKKEGVKSTIMLTGDRSAIAESVALQTGIDTVYGQLLPGDKVTLAEKIISEKTTDGKVVFVGDGINDAPVLARADIGIAMGGMGSEAAIEAADIVIMDDDPGKISFLMRISKKTLTIAMENVWFALGIKGIILALGAMGIASMWLAVFADVGVSVIAIINAMRAMLIKR